MRFAIRLSLLVFTATLLFPITAEAKTVAMTNAACSKLGTLEQVRFLRYTCARFEGRLVWRPVEDSAELKASPQLTFLNAEFNKLRKMLDSTPEFTNYKLNIEPSIENQLWTKDLKLSLNVGFKLMSIFAPPPPKEITANIYWNSEWLKGKIPGWCRPSGAGVACGHEAVTAQTKWFAESRNHFNTNPNQYQDETQRYLVYAHLPHEAHHIAQNLSYTYLGDPNVYNVEPAWLREGAANFLGVMAYAYQYKTSYSFARNLNVKNIGSRCDSFSLSKLGNNPQDTQGCEYNNGTIAAEYLVWKTKDLKSLLWFYLKGLKDDGTDTAFEKAYGFSLASFIKEADKYIASQTN